MFSGKYWKGVSIPWWAVVLLVAGIVAIVVAAIAVINVVQKKKGVRFEYTTKDLTYGAICLAASYALSFISIYSMPSGGTITPASALPMLIYCYYFGFRKSLVVSTAYSLLQLIQKPYIVSPWSALLDYFVPFMAMSLMGLLRYSPAKYDKVIAAKKPALTAHGRFFIGVAVYFIVRYFSHVLAGVLFWADGIDFLMWSGDLTGAVAWGYSATYNLCFLLPDTLIAAGAGVALLASKTFNTFMASSANAFKNADRRAKDNQGA